MGTTPAHTSIKTHFHTGWFDIVYEHPLSTSVICIHMDVKTHTNVKSPGGSGLS